MKSIVSYTLGNRFVRTYVCFKSIETHKIQTRRSRNNWWKQNTRADNVLTTMNVSFDNNDSNNLHSPCTHGMKGVGVIDAIYNMLKSDKSQTHRESVTTWKHMRPADHQEFRKTQITRTIHMTLHKTTNRQSTFAVFSWSIIDFKCNNQIKWIRLLH